MILRYLLPGIWLAWGLSYPIMSWSLEAVDMFSSRLIIMAASGIVLITVAALLGRGSVWPQRETWGRLALAAFFNMSLFQVCLISGVFLLGPTRTPILIYTMPAWSALFAALLLKERISPRVMVSAALGLVAVALIVAQERRLASTHIGTALTVLAAISFGIGTVLTKAARWPGDPTAFAGWQLLVGAIPIVPLWWALYDHTYFHPGETRGLLSLAYLTIVANSLAYFCWFRVIEALPASVAGITTLVVPCVGFGSSALLIGGGVSHLDVLALGLVLVSVTLVLAQRAPERATPAREGSSGP
ncbi:MAG TPA: EamA family transporter [Hyphomicrobiaceae bacterium]|jgi:probable blue pigment (indigoidine) exporter|nr:EamA family transporter [Hyphomicrobiaceae bacterium]